MIYRIININDNLYNEKLYQKAYNAMDDTRKAKADRYRQKADKRCCVFADMLLRQMLSEHHSIDAPEFYTDEKGKPHIKGDKVHFSISHSGEYVACASDLSPVGTDIEKIRTVNLPLVKRVCTEEELQYVFEGDNIQNLGSEACVRFLQLWCAKEAYLKYTGEGLAGGLKSLSFANRNGIISNPLPHISLHISTTQEYVCAIIREA